MTQTRICPPHPGELEGEPHEVAAAAVGDLKQLARYTRERADAVERQVRNAVMQDALDQEPEVLMELYPTVNDRQAAAAEEVPHAFYEATAEAELVVRIGGALRTIEELVARLEQGLQGPESGPTSNDATDHKA